MCEDVLYNAVGNQINDKTRLSDYLDGAGRGVLTSDMLSQENECVLGKWLQGDGQQYGHIPAFNTLKELHVSLHKCTSDVVSMSDSGEQKVASKLFHSEYTSLSRQITHTLVRLNSILNGCNNNLFV